MPGIPELLILGVIFLLPCVCLAAGIILYYVLRKNPQQSENLNGCPNCGSSVSIRANNCHHCGTPLKPAS